MGRHYGALRKAQKAVWDLMDEKGFHQGRGSGRDDTLVRLALIHTEVSEATQLVKRHWLTGGAPIDHLAEFGRELADIVYRVLDLAECSGVDLEIALEQVHENNARRPFKYGTPEAAARATDPFAHVFKDGAECEYCGLPISAAVGSCTERIPFQPAA